MELIERFLKYVSFDTRSQPDADTFPSTEKQKALGAYLVEEMKGLGIGDAKMDEYGYVTGTIPGNLPVEKPVMGLIAHMDTEPSTPGDNIKPRIVKNYDGGDIVLNRELGIVLRAEQFPHMKKYRGQDLVVTDGTTLLGADDKAGIAAILTVAETLMKNPDLPHGTLRLGFTPDEEVGTGVDHFDVEAFGADYAYTLDGGDPGEISYENFNAAQARIQVKGLSVHPGGAKNQMKNAIRIAMELDHMLPPEQKPEYTEGRDGFLHITSFTGDIESAHMEYIIRDHDMEKFQEKKTDLQRVCGYLNEKYGADTVKLTVTDTYYNMLEKLKDHMFIVDQARKAMEELGVKPFSSAIRGGTDGCRLSYMGLPCPNLCTGGVNAHGRFECLPIQSLEKVTEILLKIIEVAARD